MLPFPEVLSGVYLQWQSKLRSDTACIPGWRRIC